MKRQWTTDELTEHWTLHAHDLDLLANKTGPTRLGFALLLKYFQHEGRFLQVKGDIPAMVIVHVAQQLALPPELYMQYDWTSRTIEYHRAQIRQALGFREATVQDADDLAAWLVREVIPHEHRFEHLQAAVYAQCRACHLEPPTVGRIERLVRSAFRTYEDHLYHAVLTRIGPDGLTQIDALLAVDASEQEAPAAAAEERDVPLTPYGAENPSAPMERNWLQLFLNPKGLIVKLCTE